MRRLVGVALLALAGIGCTSVKMVQRNGCWVRRTEKVFGRVLEEVGPCARPLPRWSEDRLTRLVQECIAQADWRWTTRALEVWSRGLPYPTPQPRQEELLRACMDEVRTGMAAELDAAALRSRVAEVSGERDALRVDLERDRSKLQESQEKLTDWLGKSHDQIAEWLGQAAQKPPGAATASATSNATSDGKASNESDAQLTSESGATAPAAVAAPIARTAAVAPAGESPRPGPDAAPPAPARPARAKPPHARRAATVVPTSGAACPAPCDAAAAAPPEP
jgi:hypothetical protein